MENRVYNFSPGPAMLPLQVLEEAQRDLLALPGTGMSVMEISHRSKTFTDIIEGAEANLRRLYSIPDNYHVLFLQGGAQLQFAMLPMNLMQDASHSADYILTGTWGNKALKEGKTQGGVRVAWNGEPTRWRRVPSDSELELNSHASYVHMTSNETIQGVQFATEPEVGDVPLACDASSDFLSRPLPIEKYGVLYACAQKNAGPAGVTIVIIRDDLAERSPKTLPAMLSYKVQADGKSLVNTPPCFAIYVVKLVTEWIQREFGDLAGLHEHNKKKAGVLLEAIAQSDGYYRAHAEPESQSLMNVAFRLPTPELEEQFLKGTAEQGLTSLKGHRSVGGCRASIYNAMPIEGVQKLADFMGRFRAEHPAAG